MMLTRLICCMFLLLGASLPLALEAAQEAVTLPEGTEIFLRLGRELDPAKLRVEDKFYGDVAVPLTIDDRIVIPAGAQILGRVVDVGQEAGEFQVGLSCETLLMPDNRRYPLSGDLMTREGEIPEEGEGDSSATGVRTVDGAVQEGVRRGVNALVGWLGRKPEPIGKGAIITVSLTRGLTIGPQQP